MSEIEGGGGGSVEGGGSGEVSSSSEVSETSAAETGGESSEATQEAATEEAGESGGFDEDTDTTESPEDSAEEYDESDSEGEPDDSQEVGFSEGNNVENTDSQYDGSDYEYDDTSSGDEDGVGFNDSDDDIGDGIDEDTDSDTDSSDSPMDENNDESFDEPNDYEAESSESDWEDQEDEDVGETEDYSDEESLDDNDSDDVQDDGEVQTEDTDSNTDGDEADGDMDNDDEPDGSEADTEADTEDGDDIDDDWEDQEDEDVGEPEDYSEEESLEANNDDVQDDGEAQTEDTDSTADGNEADGDMDNDGEPDGSEADTEADTEDGDDIDDNDEEDPGELEDYSDDDSENRNEGAESTDGSDSEREQEEEEQAAEEENQKAAERAEDEAENADVHNADNNVDDAAESENRNPSENGAEQQNEPAETESTQTVDTENEAPRNDTETQNDSADNKNDSSTDTRDQNEEQPDDTNSRMENKSETPEGEDAYRTAMNNMADYMNGHNYGLDDYSEYSRDPEWQKLNADLQQSLGMDVTTDVSTPLPESGKDVSATELPYNCVMVNASDIDMTYAQGMDSDQFWNHHGNTKEDYMRIAEGIPDVQQVLDSGKSLDEIKQDPDLKDTAHAYFDPENMIKVEQQADGSYSFADDGRHRIAAAQEMGYDIPVQVTNLPENANASTADMQLEGTTTPEDVANKSDISSETRENLGAFEQNTWDNLSQVEKEQAVEKLRDSIAEDLQLENKPNIAYYNSEDPGDYGGYAASNNTIYINRFNMGDATETADTIAHESRHCWQHERADNPQTGQDQQFKENFDNYIRPEDDFRAYKDQIVESDAREYAANVTNMIPEESATSYLDDETVDKYVSEPDGESNRAPPEDLDVNSKTLDTSDLPADFESKEKSGDYSTKIDGKVEELEKEPLPDSIAKSFKDGEYRTVVTKEPITLYRVYGGDATMEGSYCTTEPCTDKEKARNDLALKSSWGNTIEKEAEIVVPAGTKLNIGRVEEQSDGTKTLTGNADQVLLPQNWNQDWVNKVRDIDQEVS